MAQLSQFTSDDNDDHFDANVFRDIELDDTKLFVGPSPPALVSERESANEYFQYKGFPCQRSTVSSQTC